MSRPSFASAVPNRISRAAGALGQLTRRYGPTDPRTTEARAHLAAVRREVEIERAAAKAAATAAPPLTDGEIAHFANVLRGGSTVLPSWAPAWASRAVIEGRTATFARSWTVPSSFREGEPFDVITVRQEFTTDEAGERHPGTPWVEAGPDGMWRDHRADEVARLLRSLADALDPASGAQP